MNIALILCGEKIYSYDQSVSQLHNIEVSLPSTTRRRRHSKRCDTGVILESTGMKEPMSCSHDYKVIIYYPVPDAFIAEISRRFDDKNIDIMRGIQACNPRAQSFLSSSALQPLVESYTLDGDAIDMEAKWQKER